MNSPLQVTLDFVGALNRHDLLTMEELTTNDHCFMGPYGECVTGRQAILKGWSDYFLAFPDYHLEIEEIFQVEGGAMGHGNSTSTSAAAVESGRQFRIPTAFRTKVTVNKVSLWRVFTDTMLPSDVIGNRSYGREPALEGLGGVFIKAKNPTSLRAWYDQHLDTRFGSNSWHTFQWRRWDHAQMACRTEFSFFEEETAYFHPSSKAFMINFRVRSLQVLLDKLKKNGVQQVGESETFDYGKFAWILDPEGNKIELWEPNDDALEKYENSSTIQS
jgi:predicted enzyme related to lactoylglutathione lyase/ketosteroid isomerase-like protein